MRRLAVALLFVSPLAAAGQTVRMLPAADRPLEVQSEEVYRVGGADAPGWASFVRIAQVGFDGAGRLYVLDQAANHVVVIGPDGRHVRTIGREGGGPGEFQSPGAMAVRADGGLVVYDVLARTFHEFDARGEYVRTVRSPAGARSTGTFALFGSSVFAPSRLYTMDGVLSLPDGTPATAQPLYAYTLGAESARHVGDAWITPRPNNKEPFSAHAFATQLHWAQAQDRIALVDSDGWDIEVLDPAGTVVGRLRRPLVPREPTRADRERAREQARERLIAPDGTPRVPGASMGGGPPGQRPSIVDRIEAGLRAMTFADVVPVIDGLGADPEGRLYVARTGARWGEPGPVDVIDARGAYVGTIAAGRFTLPAAFGPDGLIATIETDALDASVVVVRRIQLGAR